mmetsp:Transcript_53936/g.125874  ORF Transcript_53936/g.125874 Transcript_53936/m.125874 type:complete len:463 (-) Transcript_53936:196-1584(-)
MSAVKLCEKGCGRLVAEGRTKKGYAFKTCCRACGLGQGHDDTCTGITPEMPEDEGASRPQKRNVSENPTFELDPELFLVEDEPPPCLPPARWSNRSVPPVMWGMEYTQFQVFVDSCAATKCWKDAQRRKDYVNLHDLHRLLIHWTRNTGSSIALRMNPDRPVEATLMVSHCWGEDMQECSDALGEFKSRKGLDASCGLWFCAFAQYQAGDEPEDVGPTLAEQLGLDPFGSVVRSVAAGKGMVVVHTSKQEIYTRLWCVYEISEAISAGTPVDIAYSMPYVTHHSGNVERMLRARTKDAGCSNEHDERYIRERVEKTGGWAVLDRKIFTFRLDALRALVRKHRNQIGSAIQEELQKVSEVEVQECLAPRDDRVSSVRRTPGPVVEADKAPSLKESGNPLMSFLREYCSFFADIISPPSNHVQKLHIQEDEEPAEEERDADVDDDEMLRERLELLQKLRRELDE